MAAVQYSEIMDTYYQTSNYRYDSGAKSSYLSIAGGGNRFISYDDTPDCTAKVKYAKTQALGGVIVWELGSGYRPSQPAGQRDVLLQTIKTAAFGP